MRMKVIAAIAFLSIAGAATAGWLLSPPSEPVLHDVSLQLPWTHSASYAGFYSADRNGDYAKQGLRVNFIVGGPKVDPIAAVVSGQAQFGLANGAELVRARANGSLIKAIACIYRQSPLVYITLASSGITHPRQFGNLVVRASRQNTVVLRSMIAKHDVDFATIKIVSSNDIGQLTDGTIDVWSGYSSVSLERLEQRGIETNVIHPDNFGAHFFYSCIFTSDEMIATKREAVLGFLYASLRDGWPRAFRDPDAAASLVQSYGPELNIENQAKAISIMLPLIDTGNGKIGSLEPEVWDEMASDLLQQGLLETPVATAEVFDGQFLDQVYGGNGGS